VIYLLRQLRHHRKHVRLAHTSSSTASATSRNPIHILHSPFAAARPPSDHFCLRPLPCLRLSLPHLFVGRRARSSSTTPGRLARPPKRRPRQHGCILLSSHRR
jgi:hypothetical protein